MCKKAVKDSLKLLKLDFFSFIASLMEPYLHAYQTDKPMMPLTNLLKLFVKPEVIDKCTSPKQLKEINVTKKDNLLKRKNLKIGFSAETQLLSLRKKDSVTGAEVDGFKKECGYLLVKLVQKKRRTDPSWFSCV